MTILSATYHLYAPNKDVDGSNFYIDAHKQ